MAIDPPLPLLINNPSSTLRAGTMGEPYAASLFAIGGIQPYCWAVVAGAVPDGLDLKGWFRMPRDSSMRSPRLPSGCDRPPPANGRSR